MNKNGQNTENVDFKNRPDFAYKIVEAGNLIEVYQTTKFKPQARTKSTRNNLFKRPDSALRAKRMLRWLSACNAQPGSAYFFTATFADDIQDYDEGLKRWEKFRRILKSEYPECVYIAVPEVQPRSGRWHFHAILCNMPTVKQMRKKYGKRKNSRGIYCDAWQYHFTQIWSRANGNRETHRANIEVAKSLGGVCQYLSKYLSKDIGGTVPIGRRNYYAGGRRLRRPKISDYTERIPTHKEPDFETTYKDPIGRQVNFRRFVIA